MPHDAIGRELKAGDRVMVPFTVRTVHQADDYCNVDLETVATMPPQNMYKTSLSAINTRMMFRANPGDYAVAEISEIFEKNGNLAKVG